MSENIFKSLPKNVQTVLLEYRTDNGQNWRASLGRLWESTTLREGPLRQARDIVEPSGLNNLTLPPEVDDAVDQEIFKIYRGWQHTPCASEDAAMLTLAQVISKLSSQLDARAAKSKTKWETKVRRIQ